MERRMERETAETETVEEKKEEKKTLTLKNSDLEALTNSEGMGNLKQSKNLPIAFSFRLADLMGKLQPTIKAFIDQKQKLIEKYSDKDDKGKPVQSSSGMFIFTKQAQWFQKEFNELLDLEFSLDCEKLQISVKDIPAKQSVVCPRCKKEMDLPGGIISADDIIALRSIIDFQVEETEPKRS